MRLMKRIVSVILTILMITAICSAAFGFDKASTVENEAFDLLSKLDIGVSEQDGKITRNEFLILIMQMTGLYDYHTDVTECVFSDVAGTMSGLVNAAIKIGYITVPENRLFRGEDYITVQEAAAMCIRALGYELGNDKKGDMGAYMSLAYKLDLLNNVYVNNFSNDDVNQMLFNMLHAGCMDVQVNGEYEITDSETNSFLEIHYGIKYVTGYVTAIGDVSLTGKDIALKNQIKIDDTQYIYEKKLGYEYLNSKVNAYVTSENGDNKIFALYMKKQIKEEIIASNDIQSVNDTVTTITYRKNNKQTKITLTNDCTFIYNNEKLFGIKKSQLLKDATSLKFYDGNSDGKYELAVIEEYKYYEVASKTLKNERIDDKNGLPSLYLNTEDDEEKHCIYSANGNKVTFDSINIGNYLEVMYTEKEDGTPDDKKAIEIRILTNKKSGVLSSIDMESNILALDNGDEYTYIENIEKDLVLRRAYDFIIGSNGKIAIAKVNSEKNNVGKYGYLVDAATVRSINKKIQVELFTQDNEMVILETKEDKVYYCGEYGGKYYDNRSLKSDEFMSLFANEQLVKYQTDENGNLKKIWKYTDYSTDSTYDGFDENRFSREFATNTGRIFGIAASENYFYNDSTIMFAIPESKNEDEYMVGSYLVAGELRPANIELYDSNSDFTVKAGVVHVTSTGTGGGMSVSIMGDGFPTLITKKIYVIDEDGNETPAYKGYRGGSEITIKPLNETVRDRNVSVPEQGEKSTIYFTELNPGDVIMYETDAKGRVNVLEVLYRFKTNNLDSKCYNASPGDEYNSELITYFGKASKYKAGSYFMTEYSDDRKFNFGDKRRPTHIYEFDVNTHEVTVLDNIGYLNCTEHADPDYLFVKCRRTTTRDVVIYRKN